MKPPVNLPETRQQRCDKANEFIRFILTFPVGSRSFDIESPLLSLDAEGNVVVQHKYGSRTIFEHGHPLFKPELTASEYRGFVLLLTEYIAKGWRLPSNVYGPFRRNGPRTRNVREEAQFAQIRAKGKQLGILGPPEAKYDRR